jgi:chromosome segregation ATPase
MSRQLTPTPHAEERRRQLEEELAAAHEALRDAEAALAKEQAAVNAFRMHCRLKIGEQVENYLALKARKQSLLTKLALLEQADEMGIPYDEADPFWQGVGEAPFHDDAPEILLPTDTPRDKAAEKRLYRQLAQRFHPDLGATSVERAYRTTIMTTVNQAYAAGNISALRDLAGELEPELVAALSGGETGEIRRLQKQLLRCKRRQRRVAQQVRGLREENTTRLWRKAQQLEAEGQVWWEQVREELETEAEKLASEISDLEALLDARGTPDGRAGPDR